MDSVRPMGVKISVTLLNERRRVAIPRLEVELSQLFVPSSETERSNASRGNDRVPSFFVGAAGQSFDTVLSIDKLRASLNEAGVKASAKALNERRRVGPALEAALLQLFVVSSPVSEAESASSLTGGDGQSIVWEVPMGVKISANLLKDRVRPRRRALATEVAAASPSSSSEASPVISQQGTCVSSTAVSPSGVSEARPGAGLRISTGPCIFTGVDAESNVCVLPALEWKLPNERRRIAVQLEPDTELFELASAGGVALTGGDGHSSVSASTMGVKRFALGKNIPLRAVAFGVKTSERLPNERRRVVRL